MCGAVEEAVDGKGVDVVRCSTGDCLEVKGRCQRMGRLVLKVLESLSENWRIMRFRKKYRLMSYCSHKVVLLCKIQRVRHSDKFYLRHARLSLLKAFCRKYNPVKCFASHRCFFFLVLTGGKIVQPFACFFPTTLTRTFRIISEPYHYVHEMHIN